MIRFEDVAVRYAGAANELAICRSIRVVFANSSDVDLIRHELL